MKKILIFIAFVFITTVSYSQTSIPQVTFNTINDIRGQAGTDNVQALLNGLASINDGNGGIYMWNASSTLADNGFTVLQATGVATGRWLRVSNGNTLKGNVTLNGTALQTAYPVNYTGNVTLPFTPVSIFTQPRSANAAALSWISNITTTGFTINFLSVPVVGTSNIQFDYIVLKQ